MSMTIAWKINSSVKTIQHLITNIIKDHSEFLTTITKEIVHYSKVYSCKLILVLSPIH